MRFSKQREAVYGVLCSTKSHPDVSWIYYKAREIIPNISLGTVYRNLGELVELGKVKKVSAEGGLERFDANVEEHAHLVCPSCGAISDVDSRHFTLQHDVENVLHSEVILYSLCDNCRNQKN